MNDNLFVGFGFGAIQAGLFLYEAHRSGHFSRLVVAEVMPEVVAAVRQRKAYQLNVAIDRGLVQHKIPGVEIYNPGDAADRARLVQAVAAAAELATALPSVKFYDGNGAAAVVAVLADGLNLKALKGSRQPLVIYTAENHNHAAEILSEALIFRLGAQAARLMEPCQILNTVIGKMSGVVTDARQIAEQRLAPIAEGLPRAFLVEEFNRILITRIRLKNFQRGITVFEEKDDLLPFEEAKLYGHNATHALIGYLAQRKGYPYMSDAGADPDIMPVAREAFLEESGQALCRRYRNLDPLFTPAGYARYVHDLLKRMMNRHLRDAVERIIRDPRRKLGWDDRLVGTMRLALREGLTPRCYARGAAAALQYLAASEHAEPARLLEEIWGAEAQAQPEEARQVRQLITEAASQWEDTPS